LACIRGDTEKEKKQVLQRIISIKNVGRFKNCAALGDVSLRRYTLIFAENGRGKTTMCAILRSLFTNTPAIIVGRRTLGMAGDPEVQLLTAAAGAISFRNGAWTAAFPDVAVFDGTYVSENVFAGDSVGTEHRRNLYRVIIGAQGVALAARMDTLEEQIRTKNTEIRDNRALMQRYLAQGISVEGFIALPEDQEIDAKLTAKEQELQAGRRSAQLQQRAALAPATVPGFPAAFAQVLAKTLADVSADAEQRVSEHLERHRMQARGEAWLTEGLGYVAGDTCPFCGQGVAGVELLRAYRDFFSREYHALRQEVTRLSGQVEAAIGERVSGAIEQTLVSNNGGVEFWQPYCELVAPVLPEAGRAGAILTALGQAAQSLLRRKNDAPLEAVPPDEAFTLALTDFEALRTSMANYNAAVAAANAVIGARKAQAQAANLRDIDIAMAGLRAQKLRHTDEARDVCAADVRLQGEKATLEGEKATAREQLDTYTEQVITRYGQSINRYLEKINAGFRITTPRHTYRGGPPSTSYQILINQNAVDLGDGETPVDRPSFKNTLSSGDRNTLALAFFLANLETDPNRARKVVVFDDPVTSMDAFRRRHTVQQIVRCGDVCAQIIVLSHDPSFLHLIWDRIAPAERKTLWLARVGEENTTIVEWDIERAVQARYRADIDTLQRYLSDAEGEPLDVIRKIRPVLEGYCRTMCPTQFSERDMMGVIVDGIRGAGAGHALFGIADDLDELNIYCRPYMHGEGPNPAAEPIDNAELEGYARRALLLVGCLS
jgi:wobble nucleotide-excising tRNase